MFLAGLEINVDILLATQNGQTRSPRWQLPIPLAVLNFGLTILLANIVGYAL